MICFSQLFFPQQIRIRLSVWAAEARPFEWSYALEKDGFYYRFYNDDSFFLVCARQTKLGPTVRNQRVFNGKLIPEENGTRIEGKFGMIKLKMDWVKYIGFAVFAVWSILALRNILPILIVIPYLYIILVPGPMLDIVSGLYRKQETAVLAFIEENLMQTREKQAGKN